MRRSDIYLLSNEDPVPQTGHHLAQQSDLILFCKRMVWLSYVIDTWLLLTKYKSKKNWAEDVSLW